jgi:FAD/FMN-containing dehydrogenase
MNQEVIRLLLDTLGKDKVFFGESVKERYHHIWKMDEPLQALAVVVAKNVEDVSFVLRICNETKTSVVVHGGLTNLVGSTETVGNEVVITLEKLNEIIEVDQSSRTITAESGVILEDLQIAAKNAGLLFPLNFGAKGSAQIGGVISTNAGGLRVFRYGMTRALVLGLEAVLADGTIISSMKKIIKDNSGYDLKQMFIGSEGTLGVITKAVLKLVESPSSRVTAFVAFDEYQGVVDFLKYMDKGMAGTLSGYELIWGETYTCMTSPPAIVKPPLAQEYKYYVLVEGLGSDQEGDQKRLESLLEYAFENEMILDAAMAHTESDLEWFWNIREDVHVIKSQCNNDQHFDISLPISLIGDLIEQMKTRLLLIKGVEKVFPFGHVADGNVHFIIGKEDTSDSLREAINDVIYLPLQAIGGSVSAEHGIGLHKKKYLSLCRTEAEIDLMRRLKKCYDPRGILNPGKVL